MSNETNKPESFAELFEQSLASQEMRQGEVITAEVVRVDYNFVVVNAGLKSEAYVPIEEFKDDKGEVTVQPGDFVSVAIESVENGYGDTILSRDKAKRLAAWMNLEQALESGELVTGTVTGKVKGGLTVMTNGIRAFLPGSLVDTRPVKDTTPYEGKTFEFKVIKLDRKRNNVVVSRRAVVEANMGEERAKLLETLQEGAIVKGIVKNITDYGAFVEIETGIEGLVHVSEMDWTNKNVDPKKIVELGEEVEVMVLDIDEDRRRISLGMKQCKANPWEEFNQSFKKGDKVLNMNYAAVDRGLQPVEEIRVPDSWKDLPDEPLEQTEAAGVPDYVRDVLIPVNAQAGDKIPVSKFLSFADGVTEVETSKYEKRGIAVDVPQWLPDNCIGCNQCSKNGCVFTDDGVNDFIAKARQADGFVFGTPVYYAHPSGRVLSFLDRVFYAGGSAFAGKPGAAVASARRAGTTASLDALGGKYHTPEGTSVWLADVELEPYQALLVKNK